MAESNVNIMLDTVRRNRISVIYAVENDYGARFITAAIMTDGKKKTIEGTAAVTINAERPDGQRKAFEGSVNEDGTVRVPVTQWMLEFEGEVVCSVSVVTSTSRLTTTHFYIQAQYSVWDGTSTPSADDPDKDVILEIIASENVRIANENERIDAENDRKTAEAARIDAENIRIANENARVSNEAERVSAETVRKAEFATWQGEIGKISAFDKRIENIEAAVSPGLVTPTVDDSAAYSKDVPTGALPNAMISEVGGMTRKCMNLIPFPYYTESKTVNGVTYAINSDGSVSVSGTPTENTTVYLTSLFDADKAKYFISLQGSFSNMYIVWDLFVDGNREYQSYHTAYGFDLTGLEGKPQLRVGLMPKEAGVVVSGTCKPTLNKGDTALPYEPYFEGLRDAKVTAVESVGVNLYCGSKTTEYSGNNITYKWDKEEQIITITSTSSVTTELFIPLENVIDIVGGETYSIKSVILENTSTLNWLFGICDSNRRYATSEGYSALSDIHSVKTYTFAKDAHIDMLHIFVSSGGAGSVNVKFKLMLNKGTTALPYSPYFKNTFQIPEAVQALDGYGQGISKEYCNKIVLDTAEGVKKFVKSVGVVDMGTLDWVLNNANVFQSSTLGKIGNYLICSKYEYDGIVAGNADAYSKGDKTISIYGIDKRIYVRDDSFTDAATFKASMQGVMLVYVLATPIETDLSDYFDEDNLIGVEGGGTVTMVNKYEYDVPSVIEYTVKGVDAT